MSSIWAGLPPGRRRPHQCRWRRARRGITATFAPACRRPDGGGQRLARVSPCLGGDGCSSNRPSSRRAEGQVIAKNFPRARRSSLVDCRLKEQPRG
ncbi:hypothetical protein NL676_006733 [Syzygium grande]|nr:hypothetical protein NL676_006733 [Syzygium grande]